MTDVPVLIVAFNRADRLATLIDRLREVKPGTVYVAVDGPRPHVADEVARVVATRERVELIDWPCEVHTLFREQNLGCGRGVSGAISWLFEHEERGIILEDDVLPDPSFFRFCEELLVRYESDPRVWAVSGCNFVPPAVRASAASYRFARVPHIWGWATWRRSWSPYEFNLARWRRRLPARELWQAAGRSPAGFAYWSAMFDVMGRGLVDTWDLQATHAAFVSRGLTATANVNLIENLGFGSDSTHTEVRPTYLREAERLTFPLVHPTSMHTDSVADSWTRKHVLEATWTGIGRQGLRFLRRSAAR